MIHKTYRPNHSERAFENSSEFKARPLPEIMDTKHLLHSGEYHTLFMFLEIYSSFNMFLAHPHVAVATY